MNSISSNSITEIVSNSWNIDRQDEIEIIVFFSMNWLFKLNNLVDYYSKKKVWLKKSLKWIVENMNCYEYKNLKINQMSALNNP